MWKSLTQIVQQLIYSLHQTVSILEKYLKEWLHSILNYQTERSVISWWCRNYSSLAIALGVGNVYCLLNLFFKVVGYRNSKKLPHDLVSVSFHERPTLSETQASCGNSSGMNLLPRSPRHDTWSRVSAANSATTCSYGIRPGIQIQVHVTLDSTIIFLQKFCLHLKCLDNKSTF